MGWDSINIYIYIYIDLKEQKEMKEKESEMGKMKSRIQKPPTLRLGDLCLN